MRGEGEERYNIQAQTKGAEVKGGARDGGWNRKSTAHRTHAKVNTGRLVLAKIGQAKTLLIYLRIALQDALTRACKTVSAEHQWMVRSKDPGYNAFMQVARAGKTTVRYTSSAQVVRHQFVGQGDPGSIPGAPGLQTVAPLVSQESSVGFRLDVTLRNRTPPVIGRKALKQQVGRSFLLKIY